MYNLFLFLFLFLGLYNFNIKSGCYGEEKSDQIQLKLYDFTADKDLVYIKYNNPTENREYRELIPKETFKNNYFYVECEEKDFFNGLILMQYTNGSVDDDNKKSYKIISLENFEKNKDKDKPGTAWYVCQFKQVKFLDYEKDGEYILNDNADEYFKNIKEKKISKILSLTKDKIKQTDSNLGNDTDINKQTTSTKTINVKIPKRLLKDK